MPDLMQPVVVGPATAERLPTLVDVFARAFVNDPLVRWPMADVPDIGARLVEFWDTLYGTWSDGRSVSEAGGGAGFAVWIPLGHPGDSLDVDEGQLERLRPLTDDAGARFHALWTWIQDRVPDDVWYLDAIGVEPLRQGEGIGTALIRFGLARAEAEGIDTFLETAVERNVGYYQHLGFRVIEKGTPAEGGPHIWFMRRAS